MLGRYGIGDGAVKLIEIYLDSRYQYIDNNDRKSEKMLSSIGAPQGSVHASLLFLTFINDLPNGIRDGNFILFANDSYLLRGGGDLDSLLDL